MNLRHRVLSRVAEFVVAHPVIVVVVAVILTLQSFHLSKGLELKVSRLDFLPPNDAAVEGYRKFIDNFGGVNAVLLVLEGPVEERRLVSDEVSPRLQELQSWIRSVTYKVDVNRYEAQGLYLQKPERLTEIHGDLMEIGPLLRALAGYPHLSTFFYFIADEMADEDRVAPTIAKLIDSMEFIRTPLLALEKYLDAPESKDVVLFPELDVKNEDSKRMRVDEAGYLVSKNGEYSLMVLSPACLITGDDIMEAFIKDVDDKLAPVLAKHPKVKIAKAGGPIRQLEEENTVDGDLVNTSAIAAVGIFLICFMAHGSLIPSGLILLVLVLVVSVTMAFTRFTVGHLNLISAVFVAIIFGLGDDFGNYVIILTKEWLPERGRRAYVDAIVTAGSSMLSAAVTMAAAFLSLTLHDFVAFQELGIIAGTGILVSYVAMHTVLPAGLLVWEMFYNFLRRVLFKNLEDAAESTSTAVVVHSAGVEKPMENREPTYPVSRFLMGLLNHRLLVIVVFGAALAVTLPVFDKTPYEYDLQKLMPEGGHSDRWEKVLRAQFSISSDFNVISSQDMQDVYRVHEALENAGSVSKVDTLAFFIPRPSEEKGALMANIGEWAESIPSEGEAMGPSAAGELIDSLDRLLPSLKEPKRMARMEESRELQDSIARLEADIARIRAKLAAMKPEDGHPSFVRVDAQVVKEVEDFRGFMARASRTAPYTLETLPDELKSRFIGHDGSLVTYITPSLDLSSEANSGTFYEDCKKADKAVTGIPVISFRVMNLIKEGWMRAAFWALLTIIVMVLLDVGSLWFTLLSFVPLVFGAFCMAGSVHYFGAKWNILNSVALPIYLGIGVDYGVNLIHRYKQEGDLRVAVGSTGRAILYSALTSCFGFFCMAAADHRGLQSFGLTLFSGIFFAMLAAIMLMPALMRARPASVEPELPKAL